MTGHQQLNRITQALQVHLLPIESHPEIKIVLLMYECLNGIVQISFSKSLTWKPHQGLRSTDVLNVTTTKL